MPQEENRKRWSRQPTLAAARPDLIAEWHSANKLSPVDVTAGSGRRVRWCCSSCAAEWETAVSNRTYRGSGCPECAKRGQRRVSLLEKAPWAATEYDIEANGSHPRDIPAYATTLAWWRCPDCGHKWQAQPASRVGTSTMCPQCATRSRAGRRTKPRE